MDDVINEVIFRCLQCGKEFMVPQGSRRRFCQDCTLKRIVAGTKQPKKGGKRDVPSK